jgi:hypothetical protein
VDDSEERDVIPARKDGIFMVHYSEKESVELDVDNMEINTLWRLEHILRAESTQQCEGRSFLMGFSLRDFGEQT